MTAILGKSVHTLGGVGYGLGLFLFNCEVARLAAGGEGSVSAAQHSAVYTRLSRLTLNQTIQQVLLKARPALLDLFLHAV